MKEKAKQTAKNAAHLGSAGGAAAMIVHLVTQVDATSTTETIALAALIVVYLGLDLHDQD